MSAPSWKIATRYSPRKGDGLLLAYESPRKPCFRAEDLPEPVAEAAEPHADQGGTWTVFCGKAGTIPIRALSTRLDAEHSDIASETQKMVSSAVSNAKKWGLRRIVVMLSPSYAKLASAALEGALLGGYTYDRYLTKKTSPPQVEIVCAAPAAAGLSRELRTRSSICEQVNFARKILNDPPNVKKPLTVARELERQGRAAGLRVTLWDSRRLTRERCGGLLGVGQGSDAKPCLVIGRYAPRGAKKHLCLVGKGITFDSGGYGIKPASAQIGMKYDMGGAAMVFAAACAIARLRLPLRLTVIVPLAENAISGRAYHTTSVLRTRSGRTVEVHHTDAEGRLILADGLTLAVEAKPDWIVDAATLTGACVVALGEDISGVYGTDSKFTRQLVEAGRREGELYWELPLHMPYEDQLKTTIADCKNVGSRWGGSITAAIFLKGWVPDGTKWIHCDIAGPAAKEEPLGPLGKGAKGHGVKTLVALAQDLAGRSASSKD